MAMSEEEKSAYLAEIGPQIEAAADAYFLKTCGRTYREDDVVPRHTTISHGQQNGSSRPHDSLEQIRQDFPDLFGGAS